MALRCHFEIIFIEICNILGFTWILSQAIQVQVNGPDLFTSLGKHLYWTFISIFYHSLYLCRNSCGTGLEKHWKFQRKEDAGKQIKSFSICREGWAKFRSYQEEEMIGLWNQVQQLSQNVKAFNDLYYVGQFFNSFSFWDEHTIMSLFFWYF